MSFISIMILVAAGIALLYVARVVAARHLACAGVGEVDASGMRNLIKDHKAVVLDVREARELRSGRIPHSRHIPLGQVKSRLHELERYRERPIVVSCRSGRRSARACAYLCRNGFTRVYNLKGGIIAARQADMKLER